MSGDTGLDLIAAAEERDAAIARAEAAEAAPTPVEPEPVHVWEYNVANDEQEYELHRVSVPGGWLYQLGHGPPVYVPRPGAR